MATDANLITARSQSLYNEEEIVIKPSTELIPDEYKFLPNQNISLHIFRTNDALDLANNLLSAVKQVDKDASLHNLDYADSLVADLTTISGNCSNKSALILVFIGHFENDGYLLLTEETYYKKNFHIKNVWNMFSANNCQELKDKPKIFIFCTSRYISGVQADSSKPSTSHPEQAYDLPGESDMLIAYQKIDDFDGKLKMKSEFFNQLCSNIKLYGKSHDVIDLVAYMHDPNQRFPPIIISTLTRKFYLTPFSDREHYYSIMENTVGIEENLQNIRRDIRQFRNVQAKKKNIKLLNGLKKKNKQQPKIVKKDNRNENKNRISKNGHISVGL